jgi:hypothetical protein
MAALKTLFPEISCQPAWIAIKPGEKDSASKANSMSKEPDPSIVFDTVEDDDEHGGTGRCVPISPNFSQLALSQRGRISDLKVAVHSIFHGHTAVVSGNDTCAYYP